VIVLAGMSIIDVVAFRDAQRFDSYIHAFGDVTKIFFGTLSAPHYPAAYLTAILLARLVWFAFLMSVVVKRANRR